MFGQDSYHSTKIRTKIATEIKNRKLKITLCRLLCENYIEIINDS